MNAEEPVPPPEEPVPAMATDGHATGIVDKLSSPQQLSAEQAELNTSSASQAMDEEDLQAMNEEGDVFIFVLTHLLRLPLTRILVLCLIVSLILIGNDNYKQFVSYSC